MKKSIIALALVLFSGLSIGQTLKAAPLTPEGEQPVTAVFTVNGGDNVSCTLTGTPKVMSCSLTSITVPGKYTLVAKYVYEAGCNELTGTCWAAGEVPSAPFTYSWIGVPAQKPIGVRVSATQ